MSPELAQSMLNQLETLERSIAEMKQVLATSMNFTLAKQRLFDGIHEPAPVPVEPAPVHDEARIELWKLRAKQFTAMLEAMKSKDFPFDGSWDADTVVKYLLKVAEAVGPLPDGFGGR